MDVEQGRKAEPAQTAAQRRAQSAAQGVAVIAAEPRRWAIPVAVAVAVVVGAGSVPVILSLTSGGADQAAVTVTSPTGSPDVVVVNTARPARPTPGTRVSRPGLALATPGRARFTPTPATSAAASTPVRPSASSTPRLGPAGRSAALKPISGPAGRTVSVDGHCRRGTDTQFVAGPSGTAARQLAADGSFGARFQIATSGSQAKVGAIVAVAAQCLDPTGVTYRFTLSYQVTSVVTMPDQIPSGAGTLDAPSTATVGASISASGGGFMSSAPVEFQVRETDTGKVTSSQRTLTDDSGNVSISGVVMPGPGQVQLVMAGVDIGGAQRVLVATVTVAAA